MKNISFSINGENRSFEIFGFCRVFGSYRSTAHTGRGDYIILAHQIVNKSELSIDGILQRIENLCPNYRCSTVRTADSYTDWADEVRYLLYRYEQCLAEEYGKRFSHTEWNSIWRESAEQSIEHILPQSKSSQIEGSVHQIGNLLLLPPRINSGLRDKAPEEKTEAYRNTRLLGAEAVAQTIERDGWGEVEINDRTGEIATWLEETFTD